MRRAILLAVALIACKAKENPPAPPPPEPTKPVAPAPPPMDRTALLEGKMPEGTAETDLINAQCRICHTVEYLTQQRLSEAAWTKTITKMKKFGANVSDADIATLAKFAATYWNPDLPPRTFKLVAPPAGALPLATK